MSATVLLAIHLFLGRFKLIGDILALCDRIVDEACSS